MASRISPMNKPSLQHHHHQLRSPLKSSSTVTVPRQTSPIVAPKLKTRTVEVKPPSLAASWREIQGSDDWEDLVEPLNPLLRDEIVRYGEFTLTCYKAFDLDHTSDHYLDCRYEKSRILKVTGRSSLNYNVTKYIYATPDSKSPPRWIGYVAVSSDQELARLGRRDIVVSFRGTITGPEWIANFMSSLTPAMFDPNDPRPDLKVESGFLSMYTSESSCGFRHGSCRRQLLGELARIVNKYKDSESELSITLAGHSMGSSLALLLGYDLAELGINGEVPITVYSFGGPRVGNLKFKERCEELGVKVLRVVNVNDPVTKLPGVLLNENFRVLGGRYELPWSSACYAHVGVELALNCSFKMRNPVCVHDLDAYLVLLKCPQGKIETGSDLLDKVIKLLIAGTRFVPCCWREVAERTTRNLLQSLRICELQSR